MTVTSVLSSGCLWLLVLEKYLQTTEKILVLESLKENHEVKHIIGEMQPSPCSLLTPLTVHMPYTWMGLFFGIRICLLKWYPEGHFSLPCFFFTVKNLKRTFNMQID